jgi:DNA polymerase III psi subunit
MKSLEISLDAVAGLETDYIKMLLDDNMTDDWHVGIDPASYGLSRGAQVSKCKKRLKAIRIVMVAEMKKRGEL